MQNQEEEYFMGNIEEKEQLILRNSKWNLDDLIAFIAITALFIFSLIENRKDFYIVLGILVGVYFVKIMARFLINKQKIKLDSQGIIVLKNDKLINWKSIDYCFIQNTKNQSGLVIVKNGMEQYINLNNLDYKIADLEEFVNRYSEFVNSREHGKLRHLDGIKTNKEILNELFAKYSTRKTMYSILALLLLIGISIFLQTLTSFPYVFAIGFLMTIFVLMQLDQHMEFNFKSKPEIRKMHPNEFEKIAKIYKVKAGADPKNENKLKVVIGIFAIIIFFLSFIISNNL